MDVKLMTAQPTPEEMSAVDGILGPPGSGWDGIDLLLPAAEEEDVRTPAFLFLLASSYSRVGNRELASRHAGGALNLARRYGQNDLAAAIERAFGTVEGGKR